MLFITETDLVEMQMRHMDDFVTTTTGGSENAFTAASTVSDNGKNEYTSTASALMEELLGHLFVVTRSADWTHDSSGSYAVRIVECLGDGKYRVRLTSMDSNASLTGLFLVEAEQSGSSDEKQGLDEQAI